jgi:hypothetical protein
MTDENFKALCETHNFLAGVAFKDVTAKDASFWEEAAASAEKLRAVIEAEEPAYFPAMQARWDGIAQMKERGVSPEEIEAACRAVLACVGTR